MANLQTQMEAALRCGVPLLSIRTADQIATVESIVAAFDHRPLVQWDHVRGLAGLNKRGQAALANAKVVADDTTGFVEAAVAIPEKMPRETIVVAYNAHRHLTSMEPSASAPAIQAIANMREPLKENFRMFVMLGPEFKLPIELARDVVTLDDELPNYEALAKLVTDLHAAADPPIPMPTPEVLKDAVEAVSGLSMFEAETAIAMSFEENGGLNVPAVWTRKKTQIEQTRGMSVYTGTERFADIIGMDSIKAKALRTIGGRTGMGVVVVIDEIDKVWANVEHDTTGVRLDQVKTFLTEMENNRWKGVCCVGVPGGGKSLFGKALANEAKCPGIWLDFGGLESSNVGESEQNMRHAIAVIKAIGRGRAFFVATSNNATVMRPEMQRRFRDGFFFFDLMSAAERLATWQYFMRKYELPAQDLPNDEEWTGAEIRNACEDAWDTRCSIVEAAEHVLPMARSRADEIEKLRRYANGRFLDANRPGAYVYDPKRMEKAVRAIKTAAVPEWDVEQLATISKES